MRVCPKAGVVQVVRKSISADFDDEPNKVILGDRREAPSPPPAEQRNEVAAALAAMHARMESVKAREAKQAELLAKMADQDQALWNQLQNLAARVDKIFWIALVALIFSSVLILRELIRLLF